MLHAQLFCWQFQISIFQCLQFDKEQEKLMYQINYWCEQCFLQCSIQNMAEFKHYTRWYMAIS